MKILYAASEVAPFIKTGGLADVAGVLPNVLAKQGNDVRVVLPLYSKISEQYKSQMSLITTFYVDLSWRKQYCGLYELVSNGVTYYFLDNEYYFNRDSLYGYDDDVERFAFFSKAILDMLPTIEFCPDIINVNDWQTALVPTYLQVYYKFGYFYEKIKTVLTIHNIGYPGQFGKDVLEDRIGISNFFFDNGFMELDGDVNLLKAAILSADAVNTVSETYAREILTDYYGHGLQHILRMNSHKLHGVLNGLDIETYDPQTNKHLFHNYSSATLKTKLKNKKDLLKLVNLEAPDKTPVIGIISRFVSHKGFDLIERVLYDILSTDVRLVVLGTGDFKYEQMFINAERDFPSKISVNIAFSEDLANKIYSGADLFLMPSVSEPCGLAQMISMRYGTLPIVRETGGLADTVIPYSKDTDTGVGFTFTNINAHDMLYVINEACDLYSNEPKAFEEVVKRAMSQDFSWDKSANEYLAIYNKLV
ncbi:MAG: glycogen synthase GlgA [Clostridia bacterium]